MVDQACVREAETKEKQADSTVGGSALSIAAMFLISVT